MIIDNPTVHTSLYSDGPISGTSFVKIGGLSTEFLKADGSVSVGSGGGIIIKEIDGTPSVSGVTTLVVTNGTLTDNGSGQVTLSIGGGSGTVTEVTVGTGLNIVNGTTTPNITLNFSGITTGDTLVGTDYLISANGGVNNKQLISSIPLSIFNNNLSWTSNSGTVTSVTAGNGMTQTGTTTVNPTLNVVGGNGIISNANDIALTTLSSNWDGGSVYTITANDFILGSDIRLKENIIPLNNVGLDIDYVEFNYKTNKNRKRAGVIANDVEKKYPELVIENEQGIKQVSYIDMLIREVVALKEEIRLLKNNK